MKDIQKKSNDFGHNFIADITKELNQLDKELNKNNPDNDVIDELEESLRECNYGINIIKTIEIILGGGGPAMKIMYTPATNEQSGNVEILYQDWGTLWTPAELSTEQYNQLWTYCERYYPEDLIGL
tara:strand:+ start:415 stop:792 length:378 start_codon:yes stop_codon:yes gene_type:complete